MGLYDLSFYDIIERNAASYTDRLCWHEVDNGRKITFAGYKELVDRLATGLIKAGIAKGDRLGVVGKNSLEYYLIYGAAARLGAIVLPINWRLSPAEICFNLNDCTPKILFVDAEFQSALGGHKEELSSVTTCYNLRADSGNFENLSSLLDDATMPPPSEVSSDDGFVIIHTAAVAGRPRGALLSHANILFSSMHFNAELDLSCEDIHLNLLPLFHVGGLFLATSTFHCGGLNLNISKFEAAAAAALIEKHRVSLLFDFPPILNSILSSARENQRNINTLRAVIGLGTPEVINQFQAITGGNYFVMYGQTETSCLATLGRHNDRPGSAGKAVLLGNVRLVDEDDNPVAVGEVGEIALKGPMVFLGYWGLKADNDYTFRNGWHHTGDLGRFDEDGFLFYAGRKAEKELIKPGGENVYPAEVEKVILQHPAVESTVVFGVPDPKWKEGIKAVCVLVRGQQLEAAELAEFVGERIARFKKPQYVEFVQDIPRKADGSIDRAEVKKRYG